MCLASKTISSLFTYIILSGSENFTDFMTKKQELFLTLILGIVNYQLEVATATPKTARH